MQDNSQFTK